MTKEVTTDHTKTGQAGSLTSQTGFRPGQLDKDEVMTDEDMFRDAEEGVASMEPHPPAPPPSHSMTRALGLNTHHIQIMKASFFGASDRGRRAAVAGTGNYGRQSLWKPSVRGQMLLGDRQFETQTGLDRRLGRVEFRDTPSPIPYLPPDTPSVSSRLLRSQALPTRATPIPTPSQSLLEFAGDDSHSVSTATAAHDFSLSSLHSAPQMGPKPHPPAPPTSGLLQGQLVPRSDLNSLVPMSESVVCGHTRVAADAGLFLGRSFRVGWGPNWTLSHSGSPVSDTRRGNQNISLQIVIERVFPAPFMVNAPPQKISVSLQ